MNWLILAIIAPLLFAISTFIDKFLVSKYFKSTVGTLIIYSCLISPLIAFLIAIFNPLVLNLSWTTAILIMLASFLSIGYLFPYYLALKKSDTSAIIPIFQTIPVFSFILAFFILGETLTTPQIFGSVLILLSAIGISLNFQKKKFRITKDAFFLALLASFILSLGVILFKFFALETDFWTTMFWQYTSFSIFGLILLTFSKSYRKNLVLSFKKNKSSIISLNVLNEILTVLATIISRFVILLAPLAIVSSILNGFQPFFVFILGIILSVFFPHLIKENITKKILIQKIIFIVLIFIGAYILNAF